MNDPFSDLPKKYFGAILADPPWAFQTWYSGGWRNRPDETRYYSSASPRAARYDMMSEDDICGLPVKQLAADDCVLFLWGCWPMLEAAISVEKAWGFKHKSCAFVWTKANTQQIDMFRDDCDPDMLMGYWTRANTEFCLLGTIGSPKRISANIRQAIVEPRREHSRKPDCVHERIERLVAGPYLELFARQSRPGWTTWGNERTKFDKVTV